MSYTERFEDYYEILGVSRNATQEDIKKARRALSLKYHPDKTQDEKLKVEYGAILARINNAADVLSNPTQRMEYDKQYDAYKRRQEEEKRQKEQAAYEETWRDFDFRGKSRTTEGYDYSYTYNSGSTEQKRTTSGQYEQRRTNASQQHKQATSGKYTKKSSFFDDIKQAAREVKEDEYKAKKGARRAHRNVNDFVDSKFGKRESVPEEIFYHISKGFLHVMVSTLRELSKVRYIAKDSVPKFVLRNRRGIAVGLVTVMLFSGLGKLGDDQVIPTPDTQTNISMSTDQDTIEDNSDIVIDEDMSAMFDEQQQPTTMVINKYHVVTAYDTLSGIAEENGVSMSKIQEANNIFNANHIELGDRIVIPFTYSSEDIEHFTDIINVPTGTTVKEIAEKYNTDVATIISLNDGAIVQEDNKYYIISNTIRIPNYATAKDVEASKAAERAYTKQQ